MESFAESRRGLPAKQSRCHRGGTWAGERLKQEVLNVMRDKRYNAEQRANYAEAHPWRNLWAWFKRKVARHE